LRGRRLEVMMKLNEDEMAKLVERRMKQMLDGIDDEMKEYVSHVVVASTQLATVLLKMGVPPEAVVLGFKMYIKHNDDLVKMEDR
jgi:hypothetical protein